VNESDKRKYQKEVRRLAEERKRLYGLEGGGEGDRPKRLSLSEILELLLTRGAREHSGITLARNSKGDTQIEVVIRSAETSEFPTIDDAARKAQELYDTLRARYPMSSGLA
jgi:DNA repair protein RadC